MGNAIPDDNGFDVCSISSIHQDLVDTVRLQMTARPALAELADFYKLFGDNTRIRILAALSHSELCVCDLCVLLKMKQPAVSHQLRVLKQARIVKSRREGKVVFYALGDDHIRKVLDVGLEHLSER